MGETQSRSGRRGEEEDPARVPPGNRKPVVQIIASYFAGWTVSATLYRSLFLQNLLSNMLERINDDVWFFLFDSGYVLTDAKETQHRFP
jgi:hypothetical protein